MNGDLPYLTILSLYILTINTIPTNSRTSTHWKVNENTGKIEEANPFHQVGVSDGQYIDEDPVFNIITSTVFIGKTWTKKSPEEYYCTECQSLRNSRNKNTIENVTSNSDDETLDCGKSVNYTYYDSLLGVANRHTHPLVPEPKVAQIFTRKKNPKNGADFDVNALERKLKKAKKGKPKSIQLYNQIGNFWRIKGDAYKSIECFRRALAVSPHNAEVLLNLARVLFAVKYYEDAIYLAQRSLDVQPPDKNAWQQYFTLGELFKATGRLQEAAVQFRNTLELRPDFEPASLLLKEVESIPTDAIQMYTCVIIICLVLGVLLAVIASVDQNFETDLSEAKSYQQQRNFNRAAAMRSLRRLSFAPRNFRGKKSNGGGGGGGGG